jgi:hypothetical protein
LQIHTDCLTYTPVDSSNYQHLLNPILREANSKISLKNIVYGEKEDVKNETKSKNKRKRKGEKEKRNSLPFQSHAISQLASPYI